ncbi:hypothetical protein [Denitrobaculum tricleocarpae]|uniref:Alginate export domain-containing protein n=1 Tax=Denitrobaculum tricleocarpae TaxID=2591009 RepID=A0A545TR69_9PROT|nr:hypothetical protein [Denitrobaculum tricleocarpae]TQV79714.1 hypothetical protein FKG95_13480 [Denitrobaculum tricleocarpae]
MHRFVHLTTVLAAVLSHGTAALAGGTFRISPEVAFEGRFFGEDPLFEGQFDRVQGGLILSGDLRWTNDDRNVRVLIEPYLRLDSQDDARTYFDLREGSVFYRAGDWDFLAGVSQVFWGVAESRNVVDIINQFDTVEDFDEGEKLGQPMLRVGRATDYGTFEAYYLPFFREREFAGVNGRLRTALPVDEDAATFEREGEVFAGDFALRYSNRFDAFDLGLHAFYGTSRNPVLTPDAAGTELAPFYPRLVQGGVDLQYTSGPWLLKLEAVGADTANDTFASTVAGFEYTFFDIRRSGVDVGLIGEYLHDSRDQARAPVTLFENDMFVGTRIALNDTQDTEILAGAIVDTETSGTVASVEAQTRLGDRFLLEAEARLFIGSDDPLVEPFQDDDHLLLRLTYFF